MNAEQTWINRLLGPEPIRKKANWLDEHIESRARPLQAQGMNPDTAKRLVIQRLRNAAQERGPETAEQLSDVLGEIADFKKGPKPKPLTLRPGALIVFRNGKREVVARFLGQENGLLVCEYPDGRRCSIRPADFVRRHDAPVAGWSTGNDVARRQMIRDLAGPRHEEIKATIMNRRIEWVLLLKTELKEATERIEQRRAESQNNSTTGGPKHRDQVLAERIVEILREIANDSRPRTPHVALNAKGDVAEPQQRAA